MYTPPKHAKGKYLPRGEWDKLHQARINSPEWKAFVKRLKIERNFRCAVCGPDFQKRYGKWQLIGDHKRYRDDAGNLIFGHETEEDVRLLCPTHNKKGVRSDETILEAKTAYGYVRTFDRAFSMAWRLATWPIRRLWRLFRRT